ncbi:MAG: hypothetical protein JRH12_00030 [Deltaproteobacteria bacterium]|nr:hypothetical protein [Deltaproteobacteria bacterium]MBW2483612.1 hypothetical protein [Deltaproteobacteria bacterium]
MKNSTLYSQRLNRILTAVALEKPDRTPVVLEYAGFAAYVTGTPMAAFLRCPAANPETMIRAFAPQGFILQSGCDIPANAKLENVQAMVAAAIDR